MCTDYFGNGEDGATGADEYLLDTKDVREFIVHVRGEISRSGGPEDAIGNIKPAFSRLLEDEDWLPEKYQSPAPESGMGGGIGQWLIFRSGSRDLSLFALVVPGGSRTPVHDHLAWGLIGLYKGKQEETVFAREDEEAPVADHENLSVAFTRSVERGDFYPLLPPTDDIHRVKTTSEEPSVSIHLLANDTGCVWRHAFDPETSEVSPFRSGYVNRECGDHRREDKGVSNRISGARENHARVTYEIARKVAEHRRSWPYLRRDGFVEVYGYSPELHQWVLVVVTGDNLLFNGYTEDDRAVIRAGINRITGRL